MTVALKASPCPEFDCAECGRHLIVLCGDRPDPLLCSACLCVPGWLRIPAFRAVLDPDGQAREPDFATLPIWEPTP